MTNNPMVVIVREQPGKDIYSFKNGQQTVILPPEAGQYSRDLFAIVTFTSEGNFLGLHSAGRSSSFFPSYGPDMKMYQSVLNEFKWEKERIAAAREALGDKDFIAVPLDSIQA